ncbi:hypothetical protein CAUPRSCDRAFT_12310 [Caulochytrium protostelioides]|uniref:Uncharacterized protein n=1 Tax=Caulochytrium protostelioides TaxID=1555241 RepID=A0A4P9WXI3_9FUNG|nr:hypothetical protein CAUPRSCDRAFT_12310 [Caulochytrium protostelioides]
MRIATTESDTVRPAMRPVRLYDLGDEACWLLATRVVGCAVGSVVRIELGSRLLLDIVTFWSAVVVVDVVLEVWLSEVVSASVVVDDHGVVVLPMDVVLPRSVVSGASVIVGWADETGGENVSEDVHDALVEFQPTDEVALQLVVPSLPVRLDWDDDDDDHVPVGTVVVHVDDEDDTKVLFSAILESVGRDGARRWRDHQMGRYEPIWTEARGRTASAGDEEEVTCTLIVGLDAYAV